jgi:acyl-CoA dehydrogenase
MLSFDLSPEQKALKDNVARFTAERILPVAAELERESTFPMEIIREAWDLGLVAPVVPSEYGGAGASHVDQAVITEELAYGCSGIQTSITASTLAATPVILGGNDAQKKKYLGMITNEFALCSYATTEPQAGSDVAAMQTRAVQKGDDWVLNGSKCFITNASYARWYVIFATIDPKLRHKGIAAFIVDRDLPGVSVGKKEDKLGQRSSDTNTVILEDVVLPKANLLAPPGEGFKLAMQTFDATRPDIGMSAAGLMRRCIDECVRYAKERKTFGTPIAAHQAVQFMIAEMAIKAEATRLLALKAATLLDQGERSSLYSAFAKALGADSAMQSAIDAVQVFGGNGFIKEYPVEKLMRDAKILQIYEGTSQIQRVVIAKHLLGG